MDSAVQDRRNAPSAITSPSEGTVDARMERQLIDEQLLRQIIDGDPLAFAHFYDRHASRILGLLIRNLRNRADAEDVLQDVFYQVWRTASHYAPHRSSPEVWLTLIARSRMLDFVRRRRPDTISSLAHTEGPAFDPLSGLAQDELTEQIRAALAKLPHEQRAAIVLSFFGGLTHQQIAVEQGIPLGTAKTRILLGVRSLRRTLSSLNNDAKS